MSRRAVTQFEILSGWKEIANYLGRGVRTVQRYEREMGLPILRPVGKSVNAIRTELDKWLTSSHTRGVSAPKREGLKSRTNELRVQFLKIDSEIALTFSNIALTTQDPQRKRRTIQSARKAYNTIIRLQEDTELTDADQHYLEVNLRRLKRELQSLGQKF